MVNLPHPTIPTSMFGNVNLQNAIMYCNENFAALKGALDSSAERIASFKDEFASASHEHEYAPLSHDHEVSSIRGLAVALDGKADANHQHPEYLASLPQHFHGTGEVAGLDELLATKAAAVHSHKPEDVAGLNAELAQKASTAYVDQQVGSVSSTMATVAQKAAEEAGYAKAADNEYGSGHDYPTAAELAAAMTPRDVAAAPQNETDAQKIARIGTSDKAARADHTHVFKANDTSPQFITGANVDADAVSGGFTDDFLNRAQPRDRVESLQTVWTRGDLGTDGRPKGVKLTVCTSSTRETSASTYRDLVFSVLSFDEHGMLAKVETATSWYRVY